MCFCPKVAKWFSISFSSIRFHVIHTAHPFCRCSVDPNPKGFLSIPEVQVEPGCAWKCWAIFFQTWSQARSQALHCTIGAWPTCVLWAVDAVWQNLGKSCSSARRPTHFGDAKRVCDRSLARSNVDSLQNLLVGIVSPGPWSELRQARLTSKAIHQKYEVFNELGTWIFHPRMVRIPSRTTALEAARQRVGNPSGWGHDIWGLETAKPSVAAGKADVLPVFFATASLPSTPGMRRCRGDDLVCQFRVLDTWRACTHLNRSVQICGNLLLHSWRNDSFHVVPK